MGEFDKILESFKPQIIGDLLKENFFLVPPNQRPYMWDYDKWEELWEDLEELYKERIKETKDPYAIYHFLGPMFFINSGDNLEIFDGQQRLVTLTILLQVIWDLLDEIEHSGKHSDEAMRAMTNILPAISKEKENSIVYKITIDQEVNDAYKRLLKTELTPIDKLDSPRIRWKKDSEKQLVKCYGFFVVNILTFFLSSRGIKTDNLKEVDLIKRSVETEGFNIFLKKLSHHILEGFYVLRNYVPDRTIGYEMFETLNQRGDKLLTIDLFKNLLFARFQKVEGVGEKRVLEFWIKLKLFSSERELGYFLRSFWLSNNDFVRDKKLFREVKKYIDEKLGVNQVSFDDFTEVLLYEAKIYFALLDYQDSLWNNDKDISDALAEINYLGFSQHLPLFLAAYIKLFANNKDKFKLLLKTYIAFAVRRQVFMGKNPSEFEIQYSNWAKQLRSDPTKVDDIITDMEKEIAKTPLPSEQILKGLTLSDKQSKYVLWKIEDFLSPTGLMKCWKNDPTLEHVIPKNPEFWWQAKLTLRRVNHEEVLQRLGNLTLLSNDENSDLGNIDYPTKKKKYFEKKLPLNLVTFDSIEDFGNEEIKKREEIMAKIISDAHLWE